MQSLLIALLFLADPEKMEFKVDDVTREALVFAPSKKTDGAPPLLFAFHGHGGSMQNSAKTFKFHEEWPEAVVVYPQGLPTAGKTDPDGKKPGWQHAAGDLEDRDLKFFDALLAAIKEKFKVDEKRIYASGHSNGGGFTYLLWASRTDLFAAIAPSAAGTKQPPKEARPIPVLHVAGEKDEVVPFETQKKTIEALKLFNGCEGEGKEWAKGCTLFESSKGAPVVTFIHGGTHAYPKEAPALIVKFFKEHARKE
jgi:polyhydroxybutyrate depolymerase